MNPSIAALMQSWQALRRRFAAPGDRMTIGRRIAAQYATSARTARRRWSRADAQDSSGPRPGADRSHVEPVLDWPARDSDATLGRSPTTSQIPEAAAARLGRRAARSSARHMPARARAVLEQALPTGLPDVPVYSSTALKAPRLPAADALAFPDRVLVAPGAYDPDRPRGLALLAHELTHVARSRERAPGAPAADEQSSAGEEQEARRVERQVLNAASRTIPATPPPGVPRGLHVTASEPRHEGPSVQASPVHAAVVTRDLGSQSGTSYETPQPPTLSRAELTALKEDVYREILARIRIDFERGS